MKKVQSVNILSTEWVCLPTGELLVNFMIRAFIDDMIYKFVLTYEEPETNDSSISDFEKYCLTHHDNLKQLFSESERAQILKDVYELAKGELTFYRQIELEKYEEEIKQGDDTGV
jgi:hypothetical protein